MFLWFPWTVLQPARLNPANPDICSANTRQFFLWGLPNFWCVVEWIYCYYPSLPDGNPLPPGGVVMVADGAGMVTLCLA